MQSKPYFFSLKGQLVLVLDEVLLDFFQFGSLHLPDSVALFFQGLGYAFVFV
jgi:hypothetical protein